MDESSWETMQKDKQTLEHVSLTAKKCVGCNPQAGGHTHNVTQRSGS